jgi:hypothetical protein
MLYVQQSLSPGEELIHVGHFHWMYTLGALMGIFWGLVGCILTMALATFIQLRYGHGFVSHDWIGMIREVHPGIRLGAFFELLLGIMHFAQRMIIRATTEVAVTTSRVIYKRGLVARYVGEMSIDRIEGVNVLQTIMGRLLNYGRLMIRGMGVGEVILPTLADPITFRKAIEKARIS